MRRIWSESEKKRPAGILRFYRAEAEERAGSDRIGQGVAARLNGASKSALIAAHWDGVRAAGRRNGSRGGQYMCDATGQGTCRAKPIGRPIACVHVRA